MPRPDIPHRSKTYVGELTNSTIWERFELRSGDVIVSTPPKNGTTWTQAIVTMLLHGRTGTDVEIGTLSPWLDCGFRDVDAQAALLEAQDHRRCIKSHTPLDAITYDPACTYLAVYRHPIDVHFSMRKHLENMTSQEGLEGIAARHPDDIAVGFDNFLEPVGRGQGVDLMTLQCLAGHFQSFVRWAHMPNIHLLHYADLTADLRGQVARLNDILGTGHAPDMLDRITQAATFSTMKRNARDKTPKKLGASLRRPEDFFDSGTSGKWAGRINEDQLARFEAALLAELPEDQARWLKFGGPLPAAA